MLCKLKQHLNNNNNNNNNAYREFQIGVRIRDFFVTLGFPSLTVQLSQCSWLIK